MSTAGPDPRGFGSDNHSGAHPEVLAAIEAANAGHAPAYGEDRFTAALDELFRKHFGPEAQGFLVFNGTGANLVCIDAATRTFDAVICAETAHMNVDECGAPERIVGAKLLTVPTDHGKLAAADVARWEAWRGDQHAVQPRLVSISQATELGAVYEPEEVRALADAAHDLGMFLHVDGARLANAAASLNLSLREITADVGVDLLSFGGTKNGLLFGDAVVFCRPQLADGFEFVRKQLGQLASKMRFAAVQFEALLSGDLWLRNARHANEMATRLAQGVAAIEGVEIVHPVEANAVFARLARPAIDRLLESRPDELPFHVWNEKLDEVRWMCGWDTSPDDVDAFLEEISAALAG